MSPEQFWESTPREFEAFSRIHENAVGRWALQMAMFCNAHFKRSDPFTMEEFLGKPKPRRVQSIAEQRAVIRRFKNPKAETEDVPEFILELGRRQGVKNG